MSEITGYMFCYLLFMVPVHLCLGVGLALLLLPVLWWGVRKYRRAVRDVFMFNGILLVSGMLLNALWNLFVYGRIYASYDYAAFESSPLWLVIPSSSEMNLPWFAEGWSVAEVKILWIPFSVVAWSIAVLAFIWFRLLLSRRVARKGG